MLSARVSECFVDTEGRVNSGSLYLSSKLCKQYFFFARAAQGRISNLILDFRALDRKDAVFFLLTVYMYKTNTSNVVCGFDSKFHDHDLQQVCGHLLPLSTPHMLQLLSIYRAQSPPYSNWRLLVSSWRCKASNERLGWSIAAQKKAEICISYSVHLISLPGFLAYLQMLLSIFVFIKAGLFLPQDLERQPNVWH